MGGDGPGVLPVHALQFRQSDQVGHGFGTAEQPDRTVPAGLADALEPGVVPSGRAALVDADEIDAGSSGSGKAPALWPRTINTLQPDQFCPAMTCQSASESNWLASTAGESIRDAGMPTARSAATVPGPGAMKRTSGEICITLSFATLLIATCAHPACAKSLFSLKNCLTAWPLTNMQAA